MTTLTESPWPKRQTRMLVTTAGIMFLAGCLVIPVNYHSPGSRHNVSGKTLTAVQPGVTTKQEIFLLVGEPDYASEDDQRIGYAWHKVKVLWAVAGRGGGIGGEIEKSYLMQISFDASNRVSDVQLIKQWGQEVSPDRANRSR